MNLDQMRIILLNLLLILLRKLKGQNSVLVACIYILVCDIVTHIEAPGHRALISLFPEVLLILVFIVEIRKINVSAKISKLFGSAAVKIEDAISADDEDQDDVDETSTGDETGPDNDTDTDAEVDPPDNESSAADDTNEHQDEH